MQSPNRFLPTGRVPLVVVVVVAVFVGFQVLSSSAAVMTRHHHDHAHLTRQGSTPRNPTDPILDEVKNLITRVLGSAYANEFHLELISSAEDNGGDVFELDNGPGEQITIRGNNGVSLASGLYWYLKYSCNSSTSWGSAGTGNNLVVPIPLPLVQPDSSTKLLERPLDAIPTPLPPATDPYWAHRSDPNNPFFARNRRPARPQPTPADSTPRRFPAIFEYPQEETSESLLNDPLPGSSPSHDQSSDKTTEERVWLSASSTSSFPTTPSSSTENIGTDSTVSTPKVRRVSPYRYRYYQNVCTVSYSMVWWDWTRWQTELDWMALRGINLPLAFTGQEVAWEMLWRNLGISEEDIDEFFSGPAFLAWQRMGNLQRWAGPLPAKFRTEQAALQQQILQRMRVLGMQPVLPCFAGHVPKSLGTLYPNASIIASAPWGNFNDSYTGVPLLQPTDPLFSTIGSQFVKILGDLFGHDIHVYQCDTFNEMDPGTDDPDYLKASSKAVIDGIVASDPQGIWLMQGWLFESPYWSTDKIHAYLSGVDKTKLVILDLYAEVRPIWSNTESFFGYPFIWNMLHNFGGNRDVYGTVNTLASSPYAALQTPGSTIVGVGITMEAIEHNPVMYELATEVAWHDDAIDPSNWISQYTIRRYGANVDAIQQSWSLLLHSRYDKAVQSKSYMTIRPNLSPGGWMLGDPSNATMFVEAWRAFVSASEPTETSTGQEGSGGNSGFPNGPFLYDLVDFSRQALDNFFVDALTGLRAAYSQSAAGGAGSGAPNTTARVVAFSRLLTSLMADQQTLLGTNVNFLLGPWIETARSIAPSLTTSSDSSVADLFEFNARNQVTLWGPDGEILDYATKHWDGLFDYYRPRWGLFVQRVVDAVASGTPVDWDKFNADCLLWEQEWNQQLKKYPVEPTGDAVQAARSLLKKYGTSSGKYQVVENMDAYGHDLFGTDKSWTTDIEQLKILCDTDPTCAGFNTNGWLKSDVSTFVKNPFPPCDLYIKSK